MRNGCKLDIIEVSHRKGLVAWGIVFTLQYVLKVITFYFSTELIYMQLNKIDSEVDIKGQKDDVSLF